MVLGMTLIVGESERGGSKYETVIREKKGLNFGLGDQNPPDGGILGGGLGQRGPQHSAWGKP